MLIHQRKFVEKPSPNIFSKCTLQILISFSNFMKNKKQKKQLLIHNGRSMKVTIDSTLYEKKNPYIHSLQTMSTLCKVWINCYILNCRVG